MTSPKVIKVALAALSAATAAGFVSGVQGTDRDAETLRARAAAQAPLPAPSARSYRDMRQREHGPNAGVYEGAFAKLEADRPGVRDPVEQTEEDRARALGRRTERRAYDGAPPTIPHQVLQMDPPSCLSCHEHGLRVAGLRAPAMSHRRLDSCTQCHVVAADPRPVTQTPPAPDNGFVGLGTWGRGSRAWPGAPPQIPHPTLMRTSCSSCHGTSGASGLRSTHPWRESCTQCHTPSAALDQRSPAPLTPQRAP